MAELPEEQTVESHDALFEEMFGKDEVPVTDEADELLDEESPEPVAEKLPETEEADDQGKPVVDPAPVRPARPVPNDPYEWVASVPEEYKDNVMRLKHEALSDRGRVSALSRKVNEMQSALDALKSRAPVTAKEVTTQSSSTAKGPSDALRKLKEDYPELGKQLDDILVSERNVIESLVDSRLTPIQEKLSADQKAAEVEFLDREAAKIFNTEETGVHWKDIVASEDFGAWVQQQPEFIRNAARTTTSASEGVEILRMYERDYQAAIAATQQSAPVASKPTEDTSHADKLKAQRAARKASTVSPASRPAVTDEEGLVGDAETMFNQMWGKKKTITNRR